MIKAIFFDIDGTLLSFKTHEIPKDTIDTLKKLQEKGIRLFVATGRGKDGLYVLNHFPFDGYITLNGQYCYTAEGKVIYENFIDPYDVAILRDEVEKNQYACGFTIDGPKVFNLRNALVDEVHRMTNNDHQEAGDVSDIHLKKVYMAMTFVNEEEEKELMKKLPHCSSARWYPTFCDITPKGGTKAKGIEAFLSYYNFTNEECMAFGDGGNDIPMLNEVGIGIAMKDGNDELKEIADYITDSIDEDGISKACKHFGLL